MSTSIKSRIPVLLLTAVVALSPGLLLAEAGGHADHHAQGHSLEELLVESAETAADHAALANHYRAKAEEARAEADQHERMGRSYMQGKTVERMKMQSHCKKISEGLRTQAAEFDALAAMHEAEAAKAR